MRYIRQRDYFSCGPVAVMNAAKWAGKSISIRNDFQRMIRASRCVRSFWKKKNGRWRWGGGTPQQGIDVVLRRELRGFATVKRAGYMLPQELRQVLKEGDVAALILYAWRFDRNGDVAQAHYVFCPGVRGKDLIVTNASRLPPTVCHVDMKSFYRHNMVQWENSVKKYPRIWLIRRS